MDQKLKKCLVILAIFVLTIVNYGFSLQAIASESMSVFESSIFKKTNVNLKAYYEDDEKNTDTIVNVGNTADITVEISPNEDGYLSEGILNFNLDNGNDNNFIIQSVSAESEEMTNIQVAPINQDISVKENTTNLIEGLTTELKSSTMFTKSDENSESNEKQMETVSENKTEEQVFTENKVSETNTVSEENPTQDFVNNEENSTTMEKTDEDVSNENTLEETSNEEKLIDEEEVIENATQEATIDRTILQLSNDIEVISENQVKLSNILGNVKLHIKLEYKTSEKINIEDLYGMLNITLEGKYINIDLEEIEISEKSVLTLGWSYSKDIDISSEYVKVAPFSLGETNGTIVENEISIKREITDEKYLPLKSNRIRVNVPEVKGEYPLAVSVTANKLMATKGEDFGSVSFSNENWKYDENTHVLEIEIENENKTVTNGEDSLLITYRYNLYVNENIEIGKDVEVQVEEYSSNSNNLINKNIKVEQTPEINAGELITYSIGSTEETINKGTINANYYSNEKYDTEIKTIVNVNILTSDMLDNVSIKGTKEIYSDKNGNTFDASEDIRYKGIKFNYSEIKPILEHGSSIDLIDKDGNVIYTLTRENTRNAEQCEILFQEYQDDLTVRINTVQTNGAISIEFTKVIVDSKYAASAFSEFTKLNSTVKAYVKYSGIEEEFSLKEISTEKKFSNSYTKANLFINKDSLTTTKVNENVELKIELNNNVETSDLYKNPSFELVFPKYIKNVEIKSMNLINETGLRVSDFHTYTEGETIKLKIELSGTQDGFSTDDLGNGTNIIVNANITVDNVTPKKEDQIKLYYCNETVTNYESQTKWTVSKEIPNEIIRQTNGFDVAVFSYQAPSGMIAVNTVSNYDGKSSEIQSVKQGEVKAKLERDSNSQIAKMVITTMNNTGNECSDVVIIGRVPFKGNKIVTSNEDLGTNVDGQIIDIIHSNNKNSVGAKIYYSSNENANKNLEDSSNGWTETPANIREVKSYLIVPEGTLKAGEILEYNYDFEIPENLPYEVNMAGTFSVYYNNISEVAVVYESSTADKVGLFTEAGPKLEATMSVSAGDGNQVGSARKLDYTITVKNTGGIDLENVEVKSNIPEYSCYFAKEETVRYGNCGYFKKNEVEEFTSNIEKILAGETKVIEYSVYTGVKPTLENYADGQDENGYYKEVNVDIEEPIEENPGDREEIIEDENDINDGQEEQINENEKTEKQYITEVPNIYIKTKAIIKASALANEIETNEVSNELVYSNFDIKVNADYDGYSLYGMERNFSTSFDNISGRDLKNVKVALNVGKIFTFEEATLGENPLEGKYDEKEGKIYFEIGNVENGDIGDITVKVRSRLSEKVEEYNNCKFEFYTEDGKIEESLGIDQFLYRDFVEANDMSYNIPKEINENDTFVISTKVTNIGKSMTKSTSYISNFDPNKVEVLDVTVSKGGTLSNGNEPGVIEGLLPGLDAGESLTINTTLRAKNLEGKDGYTINVTRKIENENQPDVILNQISVNVINNLKTEKEAAEEEANENLKNYYENTDTDTSDSGADESTSDPNNSGESSNSNNSNSSSSANGENNTNENGTDNESGNTTNNNSSVTVGRDKLNNNQNSNTDNVEKYSVSGSVWLDNNKNGIKEEGENRLGGINVHLVSSKTNKTIQSTSTSQTGAYKFTDVPKDKYMVIFEFDENTYEPTIYKAENTDTTNNSDAVKSEKAKSTARTSEFELLQNVENLDLGLISKNLLNFKVYKYITSVDVKTKKNEKTYNFNDSAIGKVEIKSREISGAVVTLNYKIVLENIGNTPGYVERVVDWLPTDCTFDEKTNKLWYLGNDGLLYTKSIDNVELKPTEKIEVPLVLKKTMTTENTGIVSNKAVLLNSYSNSNIQENTEENSSVQNTFISISTGTTATYITFTMTIIIAAGFVYMMYTKKIKIDIRKIKFKRIYK